MKQLILTLNVLLLSICSFSQSTWHPVTTNTTKQINAIDFPSSTVGYAVGNDSLFLKTIDGGISWSQPTFSGITFLPSGEHFVNIKFVSETVGYAAVGPYTGIYKTLDGGLTWSQIATSGNLCYNTGLFFFAEDDGFVGGAGCFESELIDQISSGGPTPAVLNSSPGSPSERIVDIDFANSNLGLAASSSGLFFRTIDGGNVWDTIPSNIASSSVALTSVSFLNDTLAYAGYNANGGGFGVLFSTDGGLTWAEDLNSATFFYPAYQDVHASASGKVMAAGWPSGGGAGIVFENSNAFGWTYTTVPQPIQAVESYGDSTFWIAGDSGYLAVNVLPSTIGIAEQSNDSRFLLYPNPTNGTLFIDSDIDGKLNYGVTDISGREVARGNFTGSNSLDLGFLTGGHYTLSLIKDGSLIDRLKFIRE